MDLYIAKRHQPVSQLSLCGCVSVASDASADYFDERWQVHLTQIMPQTLSALFRCNGKMIHTDVSDKAAIQSITGDIYCCQAASNIAAGIHAILIPFASASGQPF